MGRPSLSSLHTVVGLAAGITSVAGAFYSSAHVLWPASRPGQFVALVCEAGTEKPLLGATVEVLTPQDALVRTMMPAGDGLAHDSLPEGVYRLRARVPQFNAATRDVQVLAGGTSTVRIELTRQVTAAAASASQRAVAPAPPHRSRPGQPLDWAVGVTRRFFHRLGL